MVFQKGNISHNKGKKGLVNSGSFKKGHTHSKNILKKLSKTFFKKGNKINLRRKRPDMIGNMFWLNPNNLFVKGHKLNITNEISLYRKKIKRHECSKCRKPVKIKKQINLDVHHIDKNRSNNKLSNLMVLCRSCHMFEHSQVGGLNA